ncbi:MAG: YfbR-like 5'-deoxynucleotidase [Candidatus Hodarchaeales archaeon]
MKNSETSGLLEFIECCMDLKILRRQGWLRYANVQESIADHSYGTAVIALLLAEREEQLSSTTPGFSKEKVTVLALLHDLHETCFLDIDHSLSELLGEESAVGIKNEIERKSIQHLQNLLPKNYSFTSSLLGASINDSSNPEEKALVRAADLLDMYFRARWLNERNSLAPVHVLLSFTVKVLDKLKEMDLLSVREIVGILEKEEWLIALKKER